MAGLVAVVASHEIVVPPDKKRVDCKLTLISTFVHVYHYDFLMTIRFCCGRSDKVAARSAMQRTAKQHLGLLVQIITIHSQLRATIKWLTNTETHREPAVRFRQHTWEIIFCCIHQLEAYKTQTRNIRINSPSRQLDVCAGRAAWSARTR